MRPVIGIVIPALDPPETLPGLVDELRSRALGRIVVVNDGSAEPSLFRALEGTDDVTVLHHEANRGKGEALKTGFRHLLASETVTNIVTVDADGQHLTEDVARVRDAARSEPDALTLGARGFETGVPLKSAVGNKATRAVLRLTAGLDLKDSQTGLRAVPRPLAERCLAIESARYEFELEMLLLAKRMGIAIRETDVATVYLDRNRATHFRPIRDSIGIYLVFLRFLMISLASFWLDIVLFALLHHYTGAILASTYAARISSGTFNFLGNRRLVFRDGVRRSLVRDAIAYTALAFLIATASGLAVRTLSAWIEWTPALVKLGVDPCLFMVSFVVQRYVIFRPKNANP